MSDEQRTKQSGWLLLKDAKPSEEEAKEIAEYVEKYPVSVYQVLNRRLNKDGCCILIANPEID